MRRIALFLMALVLWYLLSWPYDFATGSMDWEMFFAGVAFSFLVSFIFVQVFTQSPGKLFSPVRYFWALCYVPVLFWAMLIANLDVVYRVIHPKMPINPGIVRVKTRLQSDSGRTALANSITLTPGTLTVADPSLFLTKILLQRRDSGGTRSKSIRTRPIGKHCQQTSQQGGNDYR